MDQFDDNEIDLSKANARADTQPSEDDDEDDYLDKARQAFFSANSYFNANIRSNMIDSIRQFQSQHYSGSKYTSEAFRSKSKLFKPKSRAVIHNHMAAAASAFFSTQDILDIQASDQDNEMQVDSAKLWKEVMQIRLTEDNNWFVTAMGAVQDALVYGTVVSKQVWDFDKNKPSIQIVAPENFRFDPSCNWVDPIESSPYLIEMIPMYVHQVKRKITDSGWHKVSKREMISARKQSYDPVRIAREIKRLDPVDRPNTITDYDIVWVHLNIMAKSDGSGDVAFYTLGTEAMLTDPVDIEEMFLHGKRPYVMGRCMIETHRNYTSGLMDITRDLQKEVNDITNQRMDNVKLAMDKRYFVKRGQQVDITSMKLNTPGSVTFLNDPLKDIQIVSTPDVTNTSYQETNLIDQAFDSLTGTFDTQTVQSSRSLNETATGMNLMSSAASQVMELELKVLADTWFAKALKQILMLEQRYESDMALLTIAGQKAGVLKKYTQESLINDLLVQELSMKVNVGMGATNPANRVEKFMTALTNYAKIDPNAANTLNKKEVVKEIFGQLGYDDGARFFNFGSDEEDPRVTELQQQVQQLQMELQAKKPQELINAEVALKKAQEVKTLTEAAFGAMQAGEIVAQMPAVSQVADVIMSSSGFIPQSGQDPNYPAPSVDQKTLEKAKEESDDHYVKRNTDPLEPATGQRGFNGGMKTKESDS